MSNQASTPSFGIRYGLLLGLISILLTLVLYFINPEFLFNIVRSGPLFILTIAFMVLAVLAARKANSGLISFGNAFVVAWLVGIIYTLLSGLFDFVLQTYIDPNLLEVQRQLTVDAMESMSSILNEEQMEDAIDQAAIAIGKPSTVLIGLVSSALLSAIPALIIAAILKRNKKNTYG